MKLTKFNFKDLSCFLGLKRSVIKTSERVRILGNS